MKKINRLLKNDDFQSVIKQLDKLFNQSYTIYYSNNEIGLLKIGISVSKKIGGAVIRNKIKRQVRMMCEDIFDTSLSRSIVIIINKNYLNYDFDTNLKALLNLTKEISR